MKLFPFPEGSRFNYCNMNKKESYSVFMTLKLKKNTVNYMNKIFDLLAPSFKQVVMWKDIGKNGLHIHLCANYYDLYSLKELWKNYGTLSWKHGKFCLKTIVKYAMKPRPTGYKGNVADLWEKIDLVNFGNRWLYKDGYIRNTHYINYDKYWLRKINILRPKTPYKKYIRIKTNAKYSVKLLKYLCLKIDSVIGNAHVTCGLLYKTKKCMTYEIYIPDHEKYAEYIIQQTFEKLGQTCFTTYIEQVKKGSPKLYFYHKYSYLLHMNYSVGMYFSKSYSKRVATEAQVRARLNHSNNTMHFKMFEAKGFYCLIDKENLKKNLEHKHMLVEENGLVRGYVEKPYKVIEKRKLNKKEMEIQIWLALLKDKPKKRYFRDSPKPVVVKHGVPQ